MGMMGIMRITKVHRTGPKRRVKMKRTRSRWPGWKRLVTAPALLALLVLSGVIFLMPQSTDTARAQSGGVPYATGNHPLVLVDKQHRLSPYYYPRDLTYLSYWGVPTQGPQLLRRGAASSLSYMMRYARAAGAYMTVTSSYRSYREQAGLYSYWSSVYGPGAGGISAPPGASQHQLGTAVDFTNSAAGYGLNRGFANSRAYTWLLENARYYGFVLSYPPGGYYQTGYYFEPWHWRYVGRQNAINIANSGLGLQGYLERYGVQPYR